MQIIEIDSVQEITPIHEIIFGTPFPYESYVKKKQSNLLYIYGYYDVETLVGYSIVVEQKESKNLYAWYGGLIPKYQGKGVTISFFDILVEKARKIGFESISLASTNCRPNMLRLAIKYGFDIYDIKKRDYGEGNKIYFKFWIKPESEFYIKITDDAGKKLKIPELEKLLVSAYKQNCSKIIIYDILDYSDLDLVSYAEKYCSKFLRKIEFEFHGKNELISNL